MTIEHVSTVSKLRKLLERKQFGENITIPKRDMQIPSGCRETLLGDPNGSHKQYRCDQNDQNIHILEYDDRYEVHKDRVDPRKDPLGHLISDSPETLTALGVAIFSFVKLKNDPQKAVIVSTMAGIFAYYSLKNM
ncbi:MAG: hypothetical protein DNFNHJIP_00530 [Candidatus Argoarchaeum ethanivorans]|uniref:Uncharacterized protein n=1 Tax=Candidatus Argoarchaeum ethanivorans TaxID=2608793 RepID=A0A812A3A8_9EURY|nr:MAG: hypothetical protein DNFNHJIP_00530 [Candidatus Argoarchaeum ethanivorans]